MILYIQKPEAAVTTCWPTKLEIMHVAAFWEVYLAPIDDASAVITKQS